MNQLLLTSLVLLLFLIKPFQVEAQSSQNNNNPSSARDDAVSNFRPSLVVVIGILAIMFSLTFLLLAYAKFCHRAAVAVHTNPQSLDGLMRSGSRFSGIDRTVIESLPLFRFSSLKGAREGLECSVCLSKFEDSEVLRLLPQCKHAFHSDCIDQWLEKHSSCPLCRHRITADDLKSLNYSSSLRFLSNQSELREDSNVELFVQREGEISSSRFCIGSSFRKGEKGKKGEELPIQGNCGDNGDDDVEDDQKLHRFNHKIIVSDVVLKNRWSNVSSSDLMFLNSEMLGAMSSGRLLSLDSRASEQSGKTRVAEEGCRIVKIKEEMERKRVFESKVGKLNQITDCPNTTSSTEWKSNPSYGSRVLNPTEKRSMSEITVHTRFKEFSSTNSSVRESSLPENAAKEERLKRVWLPIARRTVQWFANRERRSQQQSQSTRQSSNV